MKEERQVGVGPHDLPWPADERYDKDLLEHGDKRNVEDRYRYWTIEAIKADLHAQSVSLEIAIENWQHDSNIGTIVRTANAFNVAKVHVIGKRHWNRRGAMVTDRYMTIEHHATVSDFLKAVKPRYLLGVDNVKSSLPLRDYTLPADCVMVFGGEGPGISDELQQACDSIVMIEQYGSTRSLNIGVASGILMHEWRRQQGVN